MFWPFPARSRCWGHTFGWLLHGERQRGAVELGLVGLAFFRLNGHKAEGAVQALEGAAPGPEVVGHGTLGGISSIDDLPESAGHVAVLALLLAQAGLEEVLAPLEEGLGLLRALPIYEFAAQFLA